MRWSAAAFCLLALLSVTVPRGTAAEEKTDQVLADAIDRAMDLLKIKVFSHFRGGYWAQFYIFYNILPASQIYENIAWPIIVLLASMIPLGYALERTGGTELIVTLLMQFSIEYQLS